VLHLRIFSRSLLLPLGGQLRAPLGKLPRLNLKNPTERIQRLEIDSGRPVVIDGIDGD